MGNQALPVLTSQRPLNEMGPRKDKVHPTLAPQFKKRHPSIVA